MKLLLIWHHLIAIIKKLFYKSIYRSKIQIGRKSTFRRNFSVVIIGDGRIRIGDNCFFNNDCSLNSLGSISIGNGSIFGENVKIYDHNHRFRNVLLPIKEQGYSIGSVQIGDNCWIGSNVVILKNTRIGNNCVIGAGCVVSGAIPDMTIIKHNSSHYSFEAIKPKF